MGEKMMMINVENQPIKMLKISGLQWSTARCYIFYRSRFSRKKKIQKLHKSFWFSTEIHGHPVLRDNKYGPVKYISRLYAIYGEGGGGGKNTNNILPSIYGVVNSLALANVTTRTELTATDRSETKARSLVIGHFQINFD